MECRMEGGMVAAIADARRSAPPCDVAFGSDSEVRANPGHVAVTSAALLLADRPATLDLPAFHRAAWLRR